MSNKSEINQELVKAFNSILRFSDAVVTNFTLESAKRGFFSSKEDYIVISFDKNMTIDQRRKYLSSMREKVIKRFCPDETILDDIFYTKFFPFNFDQGESAEDNKFLVPIRKEVVSNLKFLLANEIARFASSSIIEQKTEDKKLELGCEDLPDDIEQEIEDYVDYNIIDEVFDKGSYLYGAKCVDKNLQRSFVDFISSRIKGYENGPKKAKDFLEEKGNYVYIKKSIFDNPKIIKDIVKHKVSLTCRCFDIPSAEDKVNEILKFAVVDLLRKANIQVDFMVRNSYLGSDEDSVLIPIVSGSNGNRHLTKEEVNHVNNMFGMDVLNNVEAHTSQKSLLNSDSKGLYGMDFANPDISYCVMNKIIESSVINKDYKLSIDPARVPAMQLPPQTLPFPEVDRDEVSVDSGLGNSPKKASTSFNRFSMKRKSPKREQSDASIGGHDVQHGIKRTPLTASKRKELRPLLSPELQAKLDHGTLENEHHLYLTHTPGGKRELSKFSCESEMLQVYRLAEAQLKVPSNLSGKDSGISSVSSSGLCSSPTYPRSEVEECNTERQNVKCQSGSK